MTEQTEDDDTTIARMERLHLKSHEIMDLLREAAPPIQKAFQLLYDQGEAETHYATKLTSFIFAGQCQAIIGLMNDLARGVHDPHRWGFKSMEDLVSESLRAAMKDIFEHQQGENPEQPGNPGGRLN